MKKILFVVPSLNVGGTISALMSIIEYLNSEYQIKVLALSHDGDTSKLSGNTLLSKSTLLNAYYCNYKNAKGFDKIIIAIFKVVKRLCRILKIDLEKILSRTQSSSFKHYDTIVGFQEGEATRFVSFIKSPNKIAWVHCDYKNYCSTPNELHMYEKFSSIVCVSNYTANTFSTIYPTIKHKVLSIHNLLNIGLIERLANSRLDDEAFSNDVFTIISVGRVDPVKRFECIPQVAAALKSRGCRFRWYILGPEYGNECFNKLCQEINFHEVQREVIYLGSKTNPYPYFKEADLLVSLSYTEACPMIFNEAKIMKLPIVTTNFGSSYEFINNGECGFIVELKDIVDTLYSVISNSTCHDTLKQNMSRHKYSNENIMSQLRELFS